MPPLLFPLNYTGRVERRLPGREGYRVWPDSWLASILDGEGNVLRSTCIAAIHGAEAGVMRLRSQGLGPDHVIEIVDATVPLRIAA